MENKNLRSSDILTGIILAALGVFIIIYSINLSRGEIFYTSAGFLPLLLGVYLAINGHRKGGSLAMFTLSKIMDAIRTKQGINTIFILAWLALYIFVFLNILPYFIATFLYLVVMMVLFYKRSIVLAVVVSVCASIAITIMFGSVAGIPLP